MGKHRDGARVKNATMDDLLKLKLSESLVLSTYSDIGIPYLIIEDEVRLHKIKVSTCL